MDQSFLQDKRASAAQCLQNLATNSPKGNYHVTCKQYNAIDEVHDKHNKSMTVLFSAYEQSAALSRARDST
jgi:hypothetical protein